MGDISKEAVLYLHKPGTDYSCADCAMFKPGEKACSIHKKREEILDIGSCGLFYFGKPEGEGHGYLTKEQSGYAEAPDGFSCKHCVHFDPKSQDCVIVDPNSPGDDPGIIHEDGCCNAWEESDEEDEEED